MSMPAMIFMRATSPSWTHLGRSMTSFRSAVEAMPDEDPLFHRLDVHVARAAGDRAVDDEIDEVDDRRRVAALARGRGHGRRLLEHVVLGRGERARPCAGSPGRPGFWVGCGACTVSPPRRVFRHRLVGIAVLDGLEDVGPRGDDLLDPVAGLELEVLDEAEEQGVGHRDRQQVLLELDGDADALERDVFRNEDDGGGIGRLVAQARTYGNPSW